MRGFRRRSATTRMWSLACLAAFLVAGPGMSGLEVAYHLLHGGGPAHGAAAHVEPAEGGSHGDHCQVGLSSTAGRAPSSGSIALAPTVQGVVDAGRPSLEYPTRRYAPQPPSRGPPILV